MSLLRVKACDADDEHSCRRLTEACAAGRGVLRNRDRATGLWRRACEGGDEVSCGK